MEQKPSVMHSITYGMVLGLSVATFIVTLSYTGQFGNMCLDAFIDIIFFLGLFFAIRSYRIKYLDGYMTYRQAVGKGLVVSLFTGVFVGVFLTVVHYVSPVFREAVAQNIVDHMDTKYGFMIRVFEYFVVHNIFPLFSAFMYSFWGTLVSLIIGLFLKKKKKFINV